MGRTAAGEPSIVKTTEKNNGGKKWEGRYIPWKMMPRL
jgi:hypothetical protein